ncbi:hypothetical protein SORBI_3001G267200 [Sorghum bicolor]|uniref:Uncharacterized protein n=1 Tax=Sorghum bicolor TaxID=4558 RepID=A0A1B6QL82_SORBI|nr:hypothetical protein SORBI_3001G267200 [Sorghum bicolor]
MAPYYVTPTSFSRHGKKYLPATSLLPPPTGCSLALSRCSPALSRNLSLSLDPTQQLRTPSSSLPLCFSLCPAVAVLRGDGASARSSRRGRCPLRLPPAFGMLIQYLFEKFPNWQEIASHAIVDLQVSQTYTRMEPCREKRCL